MYGTVRDIIGPKWSLEILHILSEQDSSGWMNYTEIESEVESSSDVVTECLSTLTETGLIERKKRSQRDVRYRITKTGEEVLYHADEINSILS
jgi:DNA-binding HxlR family transcriptional regulator